MDGYKDTVSCHKLWNILHYEDNHISRKKRERAFLWHYLTIPQKRIFKFLELHFGEGTVTFNRKQNNLGHFPFL